MAYWIEKFLRRCKLNINPTPLDANTRLGAITRRTRRGKITFELSLGIRSTAGGFEKSSRVPAGMASNLLSPPRGEEHSGPSAPIYSEVLEFAHENVEGLYRE